MKRKSNFKKDIILFILGAILGPTCDGFHTHSDTLYYPEVWILKMAWWVPLLFGFACLSIGNGHLIMDTLLNRKKIYTTWPVIFIGLFGFVALYFTSGFLKVPSWAMTLILAVGSIGLWALFDSTKVGLILAFVIGVIGTLVEITISSFDLFFYNQPDILGVPIWLPFLYIAASVAVGNLARKLNLQTP